MRLNSGRWNGILGAALALAAMTGAAQAAGTADLLTPLVHAGEDTSGPGMVRWNAGTIDGWRSPNLEHTFHLKNTSSRTLKVSHLRGSCGCETLFLAKGGTEAKTATLAPGETADVRVSVALHSGQSGEMHKYVWAYGDGDTAPPLASMELVMTIHPAILYEPEVLDFGTLMAGDRKSVPLTVTADTASLAGKPLPSPLGSNVQVAVTPIGSETAAVRDGKPVRIRHYQVTYLAPKEAGPISGSIALPASLPAALAIPRASVTGTVSGTLTAQPHAVFFGTIPKGQEASRDVMVMRAVSQQNQTLTATSDTPWLTATLHQSAGIPVELTLTLAPVAPIGVIQTKVVVVSSNGERLTIPVVGEIIGNGP